MAQMPSHTWERLSEEQKELLNLGISAGKEEEGLAGNQKWFRHQRRKSGPKRGPE